MIDAGSQTYGVEIKSSATIQEKYFAGLKYWSELSGVEPSKMYLVYGGEESFRRNNMNVVGWRHIKEKLMENAI